MDEIEEDRIQAELLYFKGELFRLNDGIQPELDNYGYLSLFKDDEGRGLSIQACPEGDHLYYPFIVGSHKYLVFYGTLIDLIRPSRQTFTPQQIYEWYKAVQTIFSAKRG